MEKVAQLSICHYAECGSSFKQKRDLKRHIESIHEEKRYLCDQCDYKATCQTNLRTHQDSIHNGMRYLCENCGYKATHPSSLLRHIKLYHKGRKYSCGDCVFDATRMIDLKRHKEKHHKIKNHEFYCCHCSLIFTRNSSLSRHTKSKHEGKQCPCGKCNDLEHLEIHNSKRNGQDSETDEPQNSKEDVYMCYYCDFTSDKKGIVKHHMVKMHSESHYEKGEIGGLFPCDQCNYEATQRYHLKRHWISKHGVTKINCDFCNKSFSLKGSLQGHIKRVHEEKFVVLIP